MNDGIDRNLITIIIGITLLVATGGIVALALLQRAVPDPLQVLAATSLGALGGALLPRSAPSSERHTDGSPGS